MHYFLWKCHYLLYPFPLLEPVIVIVRETERDLHTIIISNGGSTKVMVLELVS